MRRLLHIVAILIPLLTGFTGCKKGNDVVIGIDDMASLMADIHVAEAVVDMNSSQFNNDSLRMALKQSVYAAHGVTSEQVDSSLRYYGYHIEDYIKIYDKTITILEDRKEDLIASASEHIVLEGDSVNIWPMAERFEFSRRSPSRIVTFDIASDSTWHHNDVFTLSYNMVTAQKPVTSRIVLEYADGTVRYNLGVGKNNGRMDISLKVDSTLGPQRITGYIMAAPEGDEIVRIDSIMLTRLRGHLANRFFSSRQFNFGIKNPGARHLKKDSIAADSIPADASPANSAEAANGAAGNHGRQDTGTFLRHKGAARNGGHGRQPQNAQQPRQSSGPRKATPPTAAPAGKTGGSGSVAQDAVRQRDEMIRAAQNRKKK